MTSAQYQRLKEIVRDESREDAIAWLRRNAFLPEADCLSLIQLVEAEILAERPIFPSKK